jgi:hypothetical protein
MWLTSSLSRYVLMPTIAGLIGIFIALMAEAWTWQVMKRAARKACASLLVSAVLLWMVSLADLFLRGEDLHEQVIASALSRSDKLTSLMAREKCVFGASMAPFGLIILYLVFVMVIPKFVRDEQDHPAVAFAVCLVLGLGASLLNWFFFRATCS